MDDQSFRVSVNTIALDHKIPPGDSLWRVFNSSFENRMVSTMDLADAVYTGHAFTTWHANHWRTSQNYEWGQHLALDFDTEDERSTLPVLCADKFIHRYAAMVYTTISHTPAQPKARAVFLLDQPIHKAKNYTVAAAALLWLFGAADRQCKDAVRFFYGSPKCQIEYLDHVLPLDTVKHLIDQYQQTGQREKRRHDYHYNETPDQAEVADALRRIPAMQIEYDEWLSVLMGVHSAYGDAGLQLAEAWGQGYPGEIERKWKSFNANGNGSGAISIGTVFALAKRFGWTRTQIM